METSKIAAKPETTDQVGNYKCETTGLFLQDVGTFPAVFVATKPGTLRKIAANSETAV